MKLQFFQDGQLVSTSRDYTVQLWDPITGVAHRRLSLGRHYSDTHWFRPLIAIAPGDYLAIVFWDHKLRLWDWKADTLSYPPDFDFNVGAMAFLSDGRLIVLEEGRLQLEGELDFQSEVMLYDPADGTVQSVLSAPVSGVAVSSQD